MSDFFFQALDEKNFILAAYFSFSAMAAIMFFNWKHYVRYWLRIKPYRREKTFCLKVFFGAGFILISIDATEKSFAFDWSFHKIGYLLFDIMIIFLPMIIVDGAFRWRWGLPKASDFENSNKI